MTGLGDRLGTGIGDRLRRNAQGGRATGVPTATGAMKGALDVAQNCVDPGELSAGHRAVCGPPPLTTRW